MRFFNSSQPFTFRRSVLIFNVVVLPVLLLLTLVSDSRSEEKSKASLVKAMDAVAAKVVSVLDELGRAQNVSVGDFIARGRSKSSGGIEIRRQLSKCLSNIGVDVSDEQGDQCTFISGGFKIIEAPVDQGDDFDSLGIDITVEFYDENGDTLKINSMKAEGDATNEIGIPVFGDDITALSGVTYEVKPNDSTKVKQTKIIEQYHNPITKTTGDQIGANDLYGVEILVRQNGKLEPRSPSIINGNAFVDLHRGEEYVVEVFNNADHMVTANLKIDGVKSFIDSQDVAKTSGLLVRPHSSATFKGWYIHSGKKEWLGPDNKPLPSTKAFLISGYDSSVANREGMGVSNISIGMISVEIRAAWPKGTQPPADELITKSAGGGGTGTGQGSGLDLQYKLVKDIVFSKHTRAVIHVRYKK